MKIGILTYHCVPNFGAQLQTLSTIGYLKRNGHIPIVLHWYPRSLEEDYMGRIPKIQLECHESFTKEMLPITRILRTQEDLINVIQELGIEFVLVGSDALFKYEPKATRLHFSKRKLKFFCSRSYTTTPISENPFFGSFLSFLKNKVEASVFSVSSQNCQYSKLNEREKKDMAIGLSNYKVITVRDEWTKSMIESITGRNNIFLSPDPVFSFEQNRWFKLPAKSELLQKYKIPSNYVLFSFSKKFQTEEYIKSMEKAFISAGYVPVSLPMPEGCFDYGVNYKIDLPLSPIEWYTLIKYSSAYVGERMHPIVVSIHNSIPFFCFDEYGSAKSSWLGFNKKHIIESSKTYHIINKAGLNSQMCSYRTGTIIPPNDVVTAIQMFDKVKCTIFSSSYQKYYETMMRKIF